MMDESYTGASKSYTYLTALTHTHALLQNWDAGQYRPQQLADNDFTRPAELSLYTEQQVSSLDDVPLLSADTSVTTNGTSPEEFRSPVRTARYEEQPTEQLSVPRQPGRNFSPQHTAPLRDWFNQNLNDPYPSKEVKDMLAAQSGLEPRQVNNWFINARKRQLPKPASTPVLFNSLTASPEHMASHAFVTLPLTSAATYPPFGAELTPLVEQGHSLSHHLWPTSAPNGLLSAQNIFQNSPQPDIFRSPSSAGSHATHSSFNFPLTFSSNNTSPNSTVIPRTRSDSSFTSQPERSPASFSPRRGLRRHYRGPRPGPRRSPVTSAGPSSSNARSPAHEHSDSNSEHEPAAPANGRTGEIFQCTFANCGKTFSSKTWKRHEETKHLPRFQWTCMATGFIVQHSSPVTTPNSAYNPFSLGPTSTVFTHTSCAFCGKINPDPETHAQECEHRLADCLCRPGTERTFSRKDHLFQHLRNFHRFTPPNTSSFGADWKSKLEYSTRSWGCGFCGERLTSWEKRARHLRSHFREGWRMETGWDERKVKGYGYGGGFR